MSRFDWDSLFLCIAACVALFCLTQCEVQRLDLKKEEVKAKARKEDFTRARATIVKLEEGTGYYLVPDSDSDAYELQKLLGSDVVVRRSLRD